MVLPLKVRISLFQPATAPDPVADRGSSHNPLGRIPNTSTTKTTMNFCLASYLKIKIASLLATSYLDCILPHTRYRVSNLDFRLVPDTAVIVACALCRILA